MTRSKTKAECLIEMERLYMERAYSDVQIAERLGIDRTTAFRYRKELSSGDNPLPIEQDETGKWKINRERYLSQVRVNLYESLSLYLAARRATQQSRLAGKHAANALEKISIALRQPMTERLVKAADKVLAAKVDPLRVRIFETVARGWAERIPVRIHYRALQRDKARPHRIHPYLIEPSTWSDSVYVIAYSETDDLIIPFKIERIEQAALSTGRFDIPPDFDEDQMLKHAWGVWARDGEPVIVRLRFKAGSAARRLRESSWHPLETVTDTEDGGCIWEAPIAEWREMLWWIRQWGADCEVLAPQALRKQMEREVHKLAKIYAINPRREPLYALWAKTNPQEEQMHPLLYHMVDVGECARLLWVHALSPSLQSQIAQDLQCSPREAGNLFAFLAALHDIGKASPAYQIRYPPSRAALQELQEMGFTLPETPFAHPVPHGIVSARVLQDLLPALQVDKSAIRRLAHALGGHHGLWPATMDVQALDSKTLSQKGNGLWQTVRQDLFNTLRKLYNPPESFVFPNETTPQNRLLTLLSGFTTAADWLGSIQTYFDFEEKVMPAEAYQQQAAAKARQALEDTGWLDTWKPTGKTLAFEQVFPFSPNAIQQTVLEHAIPISHPALVILEAPTGCGKTEAALYLADTWLQQQTGRGLYVAMPTQATSNQMFARTLAFLDKRYPDQNINIHLAHGQAQWHEDMERLKLNAIGDQSEDHLRAEAWFTPRKRTLLAPFAVGTVDQALLSVLQTRHFFLRLFGLAHKVVIFDEVHAYDTYMEELFLRLLAWLRAVGTSVIVLSATLPQETRQRMVAAWGYDHPPVLDQTSYPRLTVATPEGCVVTPLPAPEDRRIALRWTEGDPQTIVDLLRSQLSQGGCAAVICNTVRRAQDVFRALLQHFPPQECTLFHARTPFAWRENTERQVLKNFGKKGKRPQRAIVVATQVIEQSLDLDFDLMISDLAPVDLLIQRVGRLHRHPHHRRPAGLKSPVVFIVRPEGTLISPNFGASRFVYEPYILWQTWRALEGRHHLRLPADTDGLIQAVYRPFAEQEVPAEMQDGLEAAWQTMEEHFRAAAYTANQSLVEAPQATDRLVTHPSRNLRDDEDPALHPQARARTRLIAPGVQIVPLHRQPDGSLNLEPDGRGETLVLEAQLLPDQIRAVLKYTLTVHDPRLVNLLAGDKAPWCKYAALRYTYPLVFENGRCSINSLILTIDPILGFRIEKEVA